MLCEKCNLSPPPAALAAGLQELFKKIDKMHLIHPANAARNMKNEV